MTHTCRDVGIVDGLEPAGAGTLDMGETKPPYSAKLTAEVVWLVRMHGKPAARQLGLSFV